MIRYPRTNPAKWWKSHAISWNPRSPRSTTIRPWRRWATLAVLVGLGALVGAGWYMTNPQRIRVMAEVILSHLLKGPVTVYRGQLSLAGTLRLSGVRLDATQSGAPPLFSAGQLDMQFNWLALLSGHWRVERLTAVRPTLNLIDNLDTKRWNYQQIFRVPKALPTVGTQPLNPGQINPRNFPEVSALGAIKQLPVIELHDARICWGRISHGIYQRTGQSSINGRLAPRRHRRDIYRLRIEQRAAGGGPAIVLKGRWNLSGHRFMARIAGLHLTGVLRRTLPMVAQHWWRRLRLHGNLRNITFRITPQTGLGVSADLNQVSLRLPLADGQGKKEALSVTRLTGRVALRGSHLSIRQLTGRIMGYHFGIPTAHFDGLGPTSPFALTIKLPHWNLPATYPAIVMSAEPFQVARDIFYQLRPSGLMDVTVRISRAAGATAPVVEGEIVCRNLQARYVHFPYPLHAVHGVIRFTQHQLIFEHMQGLGEAYPVSIDGQVSINEDNGPINLRIRCDHAYFDRRLAACLPLAIQPIWKRLQPRGWGRFTCHALRAAGNADSPQITLHIYPTDVRARYTDFPYLLRHVHGELYFTEHQTKVIRLEASAGAKGAGSVVLTGTVDYNPQDLHNLTPHLHVVASHVPLTASLLDCLPPSYAPWAKAMHPNGGTVGLDAQITRQGEQPVVHGTLTLEHGSLTPAAMPWPLRDVSLQANLDAAHQYTFQLNGRTGADGKGTFAANAAITAIPDQLAHIQASAQWHKAVVTPRAPTALPPAWRKIWSQCRPAGPLDGYGSVTLMVKPGQPSSATDFNIKKFHAVLQPAGLSIAPAFLPMPITGIQGTVTLQSNGWNIQMLRGLADGIHLQVLGRYIPTTQLTHLEMTANADHIDPQWAAGLPRPVQTFLLALKPQGAWNLNLPTLNRRMLAGQAHWHFIGSLEMQNPRLAGALPAHAKEARISLAGDWTKDEVVPDLNGQFSTTGLVTADQTINPLTGTFTADASRKIITVGDIQGVIAGGTLHGGATINAGSHADYLATFKLTDAQLAGLLTAPATLPATTKPATSRLGTGIVDANLTLHEWLDQPQSRSGSGELEVRDANIYNVPLAMGLLQIATLRLPISQAFQHAQINYQVHDDTVQFTDIRLLSRGVDVIGQGSLNLTTQGLNLHMFTESPPGQQLPVLGLFFGLARSQLLQLYVGGTLQQPKVRVIPLHLWTWPFE